MADGRICTGFSKPYVALYSHSGTTITYTSGQVLARGVGVQLDLDAAADDNVLYADNIAAETVAGLFTGGTVKLTVDGLKTAAEKLLLGLPTADSDGWVHYGDQMAVPEVGVGFVVRYVSGGVTSYEPVILRKCKFNVPSLKAQTQEDAVDWQTQELEGTVMRDDSTYHDWKWVGTASSTETLAEADIKEAFSIT